MNKKNNNFDNWIPYKCIVEYNGYNYFGWQKQQNNITIQEKIENVLEKIFKKKQNIQGASRTDAGVHAYGQVFKFFAPFKYNLEHIQKIINGSLPNDIHIKEINFCESNFSPRFDAKKKLYNYFISNTKNNIFQNPYMLYHPKKFDIELFKKALSLFVGTHDLISFATLEKDLEGINTIKTIYKCDLEILKNNIIRVSIVGNNFLKYMIRRIVGAALQVAYNKISIEELKNAIYNQEKLKFVYKVSPNGLILTQITYTDNAILTDLEI